MFYKWQKRAFYHHLHSANFSGLTRIDRDSGGDREVTLCDRLRRLRGFGPPGRRWRWTFHAGRLHDVGRRDLHGRELVEPAGDVTMEVGGHGRIARGELTAAHELAAGLRLDADCRAEDVALDVVYYRRRRPNEVLHEVRRDQTLR